LIEQRGSIAVLDSTEFLGIRPAKESPKIWPSSASGFDNRNELSVLDFATSLFCFQDDFETRDAGSGDLF